MILRQKAPFKVGYNAITSVDDRDANTLMDFGILKLEQGQAEVSSEDKERAYILIKGEVTFEWDNNRVQVKRDSFLEENPSCLHVPKGVEVKITGISPESELSVSKTYNDKVFTPKFYNSSECRSEYRGEGTMKETSTRIVRTIFDITNASYSKLVLGEVINYPGKWSSYPPHHHPQPEIYFYKFYPENGFGFSMLGEEVVKVRNNDAVKILDDVSHPQVSAPGYAMYYVWVIRHLDGNPYDTPVFEPEHLWVTKDDASIWPDD